jgi:MFS family permease
LGAFVVVLDTPIVNIAIPSIITGLGASLHQVLWVLNAYTLVYAALLITGGRLGDLYGLARVAEEILMAAAEASAEMIAIGFHGVTAELRRFRTARCWSRDTTVLSDGGGSLSSGRRTFPMLPSRLRRGRRAVMPIARGSIVIRDIQVESPVHLSLPRQPPQRAR